LTAELAAARASLDAGRDAEAAEQLNAVLTQYPTSAEGQNRLGIACRRLGRFTEAQQAYERAIVADPAMAAPHRNFAVLLDLYLAQPARALEYYERYQQLDAGADQEAAQWITELRTRLNQTQRIAGSQP
jgi:Flp pilus assembly protein TadD